MPGDDDEVDVELNAANRGGDMSLQIGNQSKRINKVRAFRPVWAQKYGEHAMAWKAATSI